LISPYKLNEIAPPFDDDVVLHDENNISSNKILPLFDPEKNIDPPVELL
jgi:hypothetical protein